MARIRERGARTKAGRSFLSIVPVLVSFINVIPMYEMGGPSRIYLLSFLPIYCRPFVHTIVPAIVPAIVTG